MWKRMCMTLGDRNAGARWPGGSILRMQHHVGRWAFRKSLTNSHACMGDGTFFKILKKNTEEQALMFVVFC